MMPKNNKPELQPGDKFNRLTVLEFSKSDKRWRKWYKVKCDCGTEKVVMGSAMTSGNTKSCGCLSKEVKRSKRISKNHSEITAIILGYKRHAERRGFKWQLTRKDVKMLVKINCFYCGSNPKNVKKTKSSIGGGLIYSGIDRIDNSKNYTKANSVPCCKICNYAKSNMSIKEFQEWAVRIGEQAIAEQWSKVINMKNKTKLNKIAQYQSSDRWHELTCGNNSQHLPLKGKEVNGKVILVCPECDYSQEHIPGIVLRI